MKHRFAFGYLLVAMMAGMALVFLDAAGVFIYFSYVPAVLLVACVVVGGLFAAGKVGQLSRVDALSFGLATMALIGIVLICPYYPTSQRKQFFLDAQSVKPGMSLHEVEQRMVSYQSFRKDSSSVTFSCQSSPDTVDVIVVRLNKDGSRVASAEYSPD